MTRLFPNDNEKITIKQGQTGDCYLLAVLDCVFSTGKEGRDLIQSMFTENADESVTLRIPHNSHSQYLLLNNINAKYKYFHNTVTNTDEITISKTELERIDRNSTEISPGLYKRGVSSNSLAVKILEHISSYYFATAWNQQHSIIAHDQKERYEGHEAAVFVSELLGIEGNYTKDYDKIIKLKAINPEQPLYVEMDYGTPDEFGKIHGYHALRIKRIEKKSTSCDFILVNPWENEKEERFSLEEIKKRHYNFCELNLDTPKRELNKDILKCSEALGAYIYRTPALVTALLAQRKAGFIQHLKKDNLESCAQVHQQLPYFDALLNALTPSDQDTMVRRMLSAKGSKQEFIKQLLTRFPRIELLQLILEKEQMHEQLGETLINLVNTDRCIVPNILSTQEFFNLVVDKAIQHKAVQPGESGALYGKKGATEFIQKGLINHFFNIRGPMFDRVTRNSGLRALCDANVFTNEHIKSWIQPELLMASAIAHVINNFTSPASIEYIVSNRQITANETVLDMVLEKISAQDSYLSFEGLKKLSTVDAELAKKLFPLLAAKIDRTAANSFKRLAQEVANQGSSEFKAWFSQMQKELLPTSEEDLRKQRDAEQTIRFYVQQITTYPVPANKHTQPQEVEAQRVSQLRGVNALVLNDARLEEAEQILGFIRHPAIKSALEAKSKIINETTLRQLETLKEAEQTISRFIRNIKDLPLVFTNPHSIEEVEQQKHELLERLQQYKNGLKNNGELTTAHQNLGLVDKPHTAITSAFTQRENKIVQEAKRYADAIVAKKVIEFYAAKINDFHVIVNNGHSLVEIAQIEKAQLDKLDELIKDKQDLQEAEEVFNINNGQHHYKINEVLRNKRTLIIQEGQRQSLQLAQEKQRAEDKTEQAIEARVRKITALPISFEHNHTPDAVSMQRHNLHKQLDEIVSFDGQEEADGLLINEHPKVKSAIFNKKEAINRAAEQQHSNVKRNAQDIVNEYAIAIYDAPLLSFQRYQMIQEVEEARDRQVRQLHNQVMGQAKLRQAQQVLGQDTLTLPPEIRIALDAKVQLVEKEAKMAKQKIVTRKEGDIILTQINFTAQLETIEKMTLDLEDKAKSDDNYQEAAAAGRELYNQLLQAREHLLTAELPQNKNVRQFKDSCIKAIDKANLVLEEHRGWKQVLADLAGVLLSLATLFTANLAAGRWRLFQTPTNSATVTHEVQEVFQSITVSA
ncbi:sbcc family protein [Legionella fallonii]|uniref:Ninein n=1 Tax=Legionella fallonii LLAP-10 TaxID=1212491 RepID=A0A098G0W5_9GAMM|nr:hypothetical protein [Legionella fallonii]CEG55609.1 conserved protein of unknown function [Legionella fallonii LLAP-10]